MALIRHPTPRGIHLVPQVRHARALPTLIAMALAAGIGNFTPSAIAVALPELHDELNASTAELQWSITVFSLALAAFLIAFGRLADTFGRKRLLLLGCGAFVGGSVVSAVAPTALVLIVGTGISGLGFAAIVPSSLSIVVSSYPPDRRGLPIGVWGAATVLFQGIAPIVGGGLTTALDWPSIFWFQAAVALIVVALVLTSTAESTNPDAERRVDATGLGLLAASLTTLSLAIIQGPTWGFDATPTIVLFVVTVLLFALFVVVERRSAAPLVDFSFFGHRNFTGATIVLFVVNFALIVALFFLPLLLEELLDYSAVEAGALLLPLLGAMIVTLPLGGPIAERIGPLIPITFGMVVMTLGFLLLAGVDRQTEFAELWLPMVLVGVGNGIALTPMNLTAMNAIHSRESGAAGGLFTTLSGLGIGLGVAISGAVFNSRQLDETVEQSASRGVSLSDERAEDLDGLLAGASDAQQALATYSSSDQTAVQDAVEEAFALALGSAFRVGALVSLLGLVLSLILIRKRPPADVIEAADPPERAA